LAEQINMFERAVKSDLASNVRYPIELFDHIRKSIFIMSAGRNDYVNKYLQSRFCNSYKLYNLCLLLNT